MAIRRETFFKLGGFHPDYVPREFQRFQGDGESGLTAKARDMGMQALYEPLATVYHSVPRARLKPAYFQHRAFFEGIVHSYSNIRKNRFVNDETWQTRLGLAEAFSGIPADTEILKICEPKKRKTVREFILGIIGRQRAREMSILDLKNDIRRAFLAGYQYHHTAVAKDPALLRWVLREDYWDWDYRKLSAVQT